ncbi:MAG: HD domain-containing protein [Candidatus Bathyarchaeia archaeon]
MNESGVLDFLLGIRSLMTVGRFSVYKCHFREDVAQHSYFTALYAMILADLERGNGVRIDSERLLRMALLHDAEEARTGDIHHPFKHQDSAFAETLDSRGLEWFGKLLGGLPEGLVSEYAGLRKAVSEIDSTEAIIVKASDKIEALLWAYEEYLLGNVQVRKALIVEDILQKLDQIELSTVKRLVVEIRKRLDPNKSLAT